MNPSATAEAKMGRPREYEDRVRVVVYMRQDQKDVLDDRAEKAGVSASEYVVASLATAGVFAP